MTMTNTSKIDLNIHELRKVKSKKINIEDKIVYFLYIMNIIVSYKENVAWVDSSGSSNKKDSCNFAAKLWCIFSSQVGVHIQ